MSTPVLRLHASSSRRLATLSIALFTTLLAAMLVILAQPQQAYAAVGDTFTEKITIGTEQVDCTFMINGSGTVAIGEGGFEGSAPSYSYFSVGGDPKPALPLVSTGSDPDPSGNTSYAADARGALDIPRTITHGNTTYTITEISPGAFYKAVGITSVTIPSSVTTIGEGAFCRCTGLTSVSIPNSVTAIPAYCFADCTGLRDEFAFGGTGSLFSSSSITSIGEGAYWGCHALHDIEIPSKVTTIGAHAFSRCDGLSFVTMSNKVTSVGEYAFAGDLALERITLSNKLKALSEYMFYSDYHLTTVENASGLESIGKYCFARCEGLKSFDIPSGVTSLPEDAFSNTGLTSITIPNTSNGQPFTIGNFAFANCNQLAEVNFPTTGTCILGYCSFQYCAALESIDLSHVSAFDHSNTYLYGSTFSGCTGLRSVTFGSLLTEIPDYCFSNCRALASITIPNNITGICEHAFYGCEALNSLTVPASVTSIGYDAFNGCDALAALVLEGNSMKTLDRTWYPDYQYAFTNGISHIYVLDSLVDTYKADEKWARMADYILPMSSKPADTRIYALLKTDGTLVECNASGQEIQGGRSYVVSGDASSDYAKHAITDIKFQSGITEIPLGAFAYCRALRTIEIPSTVKDLGQNCFYYCTALESVTGGSGVIDVRYMAFANCNALKSVPFMSHVEAIGMYSFEGCHLLRSIDLSGIARSTDEEGNIDPWSWNPYSSNPTIADEAFRYCDNLSQVTLPADSSKACLIEEGAFQGCSSLTSIDLPENVWIGKKAFSETGLTTVVFPDEIDDIDGSAFLNCRQLAQVDVTGVTLAYGDHGVPSGLFSGCTALREVTLSDDVRTISQNAFYGCAALAEVDLPNNLEALESHAFGYCTGLLSIDIPEGLYELGAAFAGCSALAEVTVPGSVEYLYGQGGNSPGGSFSGCTALSTVQFGEGFAVTELGGYMFEGCDALGSIDIPDAVLGIGAMTFRGCAVLKDVDLPDSLVSLYYGCFASCPSLRHLTIPDNGVLYIAEDFNYGGGQFSGCYNLEEIVLPSGTDRISQGMFFSCVSLTEITIPASVEAIGFRAFGKCSNLETVIFENDCSTTEFAPEYEKNQYWDEWYPIDPEYYIFGLCDKLETVVFRDKKPLPDTITFSTNPDIYYTLHYYPTQELAEAKSDEIGTLTIKAGTNGLASTAPTAANTFDGSWIQASTAEPAINASAITDSGWALPVEWKGVLFTTHPEDGECLDGNFTFTSEAGVKRVQSGVVTDLGATIDYAWYECDRFGVQLSDTPVGRDANLVLSGLSTGRHYYYCTASVTPEVAANLGLNRSSDTTPVVCVNVKGAYIVCDPASIRYRLSTADNNRGVGMPFILSNPSQTTITDLDWRSENGYFSLSSSSYWSQTIYDMEPGQSISYTLYPRVPAEQLAPGEYHDTLIITSENAATLRVPVTLVFYDSSEPGMDFSYSSSAGSYIHGDVLDFGTLDADYTIDYEDSQDPHVNLCSIYAVGSTITVTSHSNPEHFRVYWENLSPLPKSLNPNVGSGLRIAPESGLEPGVYEDTLTYYYTAEGVTNGHFDIILRVTVGSAGGIGVSPTSCTWDSAVEGYSDQQPMTITVTNYEDSDITLPANTGSGLQNFSVIGALGLTVPAGGTATFKVVPKTGLAPGNYSETLTLAPAGVNSKSIRLNFTVTEAPKVYVTVMNTTYPEDQGAAWEGYLMDYEPVTLGDKSMLDAIEAALTDWNCIYETAGGPITSIDGLANGDAGEGSVWKFYLNNEEITGDLSRVGLEENDVIKCRYFAAGASAGSCLLDDMIVEDWGVDALAALTPTFESDVFTYATTLSRGAYLLYLTVDPQDDYCPITVLGGDGWEITPDDDDPHSFMMWVDDGDQIRVICGDEDDDTFFEVKTYTINVSIPDAKFERLAGGDRYATGAAIAGTYDAQGGTVILATGANFPDALCASSLAGKYDAPILMTAPTSLSPATEETLEAIEPDHIIVVGGTGAVSDRVLEDACYAAGIPFDEECCDRFYGANRFATGIAIYEEGGLAGGDTCIIATGGNFADALSISPYAYATATPIFLVDAKTCLLNDETVAAIADEGFEKIIIVGGTGVVSDGVAGQLGVDPENVVRLAGASRYNTSLAIAKWEMGLDAAAAFGPDEDQALGVSNASLATGANFPDALTGGALCGKNNSVLLLVSEKVADYTGALKLIRDYAYDVTQGYIFGGTGAVSDALKARFDQALLG